ncbi:MAG: hypothetical protein B6D58_07280 [candidate division Zixibacteria bacterium 4484_95]|nr:MAG: hypothetical protein B6D58_07280 [candidate division Zixibacteria bacterium 4484_95]
MDKIHIGLKSVRIPKIFPKKFRKDLKEAQKDFPALVPDFNDWWNKAINFTELPHISVTARKDSQLDQGIGCLHFLSVIVNRITILESKMNNMTRDFYQYGLMLKHKESNFKSILFFSISTFIALVLAIISIALSLFSDGQVLN